MSKKQITKNFKLSRQFNSYAVKHPKVFKGIPKNACIVMAQKSDQKLTEENLKVAQRIIKKEHRRCFQAIKENHRWTLKPV